MVEKSRTRLLEVSVSPLQLRWRWQVKAGDEVIVEGFAKGKIEARFRGNSAMFLLLALGWNP
jgi:predicted lipid carrier protein YhbT